MALRAGYVKSASDRASAACRLETKCQTSRPLEMARFKVFDAEAAQIIAAVRFPGIFCLGVGSLRITSRGHSSVKVLVLSRFHRHASADVIRPPSILLLLGSFLALGMSLLLSKPVSCRPPWAWLPAWGLSGHCNDCGDKSGMAKEMGSCSLGCARPSWRSCHSISHEGRSSAGVASPAGTRSCSVEPSRRSRPSSIPRQRLTLRQSPLAVELGV